MKPKDPIGAGVRSLFYREVGDEGSGLFHWTVRFKYKSRNLQSAFGVGTFYDGIPYYVSQNGSLEEVTPEVVERFINWKKSENDWEEIILKQKSAEKECDN